MLYTPTHDVCMSIPAGYGKEPVCSGLFHHSLHRTGPDLKMVRMIWLFSVMAPTLETVQEFLIKLDIKPLMHSG